MSQNRREVIERFIGNLANYILHSILEKAVEKSHREFLPGYQRELKNSMSVATAYRNKIHPLDAYLPEKDSAYIKNKIIQRVKNDLHLRISKGYENIDISLIEPSVEKVLKELKIVA